MGPLLEAAAATPARAHGGNPWELARRERLQPRDVLDFSVDVNPLGFPERVRQIISRSIDDIRCYPDPEAVALRQALAEFHGVPMESVLPGNGSAELIGLLAHALKVQRALIAAPTFTEYAWAVERGGGTVTYALAQDTDAFRLDNSFRRWEAMLRGVEAVFVCNPNNPTGAVMGRDDLLQLADGCEQAGARLIIDEAFMDFVDDPARFSVASIAARRDSLIVLRSLTKSFAIPGLRLGYLIASPRLVETARAWQPPWPLNTFAAAVGPALLEETAHVERARRQVARMRASLFHQLAALPSLRPFPSSANFLLCRLQSPQPTSSQLADRLARRGILIRNGDGFAGLKTGRFIRVAVRTATEHARLQDALRESLADVG